MPKNLLTPEQRAKLMADLSTSESPAVRQKSLTILLMDEGKSLKEIDLVTLRKEEIKRTNLDIYGGMLTDGDSNRWLLDRLAQPEPLMVSRFGNIESKCVADYLASAYGDETLKNMAGSPGFFPVQPHTLDRFSQMFLEAAEAIDMLGVWFNPGEAEIIRRSCPQAVLAPLASLEPYYHDRPWSQALAGKRVLVVHPFTQTIERQYQQHRQQLFENPQILPPFTLLTLPAVQSFAGCQTPFASWFDALDFMSEQVSQLEFDIALIGCGAYGLPLAARIKQLGKQAIHLGGALQLLFGIRGQRWDGDPFFQALYNSHWVRPTSQETPNTHRRYPAYW